MLSPYKSWLSGETVTPDKLNLNLSDKLNYLFNKNISVLRVDSENGLSNGGGGNVMIPFTRPLRLSLTIPQGAAVKIGVSGTIRTQRLTAVAAVSTHAHLDVLIDEELYLSSLAATATSDGIYKNRKNIVANAYVQARASWFITQLDEGTHTFQLVGKAPDTSDTHNILLQPTFYFWVEQYGQNIGQLLGANDT